MRPSASTAATRVAGSCAARAMRPRRGASSGAATVNAICTRSSRSRPSTSAGSSAAGNDGDTSVEYPCAFVHVICVAATDDSDIHASFSNRNAFVDISAPGVDQVSTAIGGGYVQMSGTSMATPHVVGVAALILSAHPGDTPSQIEAALESTALDLGTVGRDDSYGYGRVDAAAAVAVVPPPGPPADLTPPTMTTLSAPSLITTHGRQLHGQRSRAPTTSVSSATRSWPGAERPGPGRRHRSRSRRPRHSAGWPRARWYIDVRARDAAGNLSPWKQVHVVVPADDRSYRFSTRMVRQTSSVYLHRTVTKTLTAGSKMTVKFSGNAFYLFGTTGVAYGRMRVTIDGASYTVDEGYYAGRRATGSHYRVAGLLPDPDNRRAHTVTITCLGTSGRRTIAIDGVGWRN